MKAKFEVRSPRVKGLSFHSQLPWLLCGLHNGVVQIWDYEMKTLIDAFTDHSGSVRGVDFHKTQPIFVTGADDFLIKVWNYKLRRCLYTLTGHTDFVRTTFFHVMQPWIVSASDDFTVRIWNWQSRSSVACLPGHNHYVMCAQFHRFLPLLASVSLDKTLRIWDLSPLQQQQQPIDADTQDLLATTDVIVKHQIDAHDKGINWVHWLYTEDDDKKSHQLYVPTNPKPRLATAADDGTVRIWQMWNDTLVQHRSLFISPNNVCCVTNYDHFVLSCGEDHKVHAFTHSFVTESYLYTPWIVTQRDTDRYWVITVHPNKHLIAAGHDTGFQIFKLFSERVPYDLRDNCLHYFAKRTEYITRFNPNATLTSSTSSTTAMMSKIAGHAGRQTILHNYEKDTFYISGGGSSANNTNNAELLRPFITFHKAESYATNYKVEPTIKVALSTDASVRCVYVENKVRFLTVPPENEKKTLPRQPARTNNVESVCFYGPRDYVYLMSGQLYVVNDSGEIKLELLGGRHCQKLFSGPPGTIVCYVDDTLYLLQVAQQAILAKTKIHMIKHLWWDSTYNRIACFNKTNLTILTRRFKVITTISEPNSHIKSAVFDDKWNILFFNTLHHLKCCNLHNGEVITVKSTKSYVPYFIKVIDTSHILACTRSGALIAMTVDIKEFLLKYFLEQHSYRDAINILRHTPIKGNALIGYLHKHGFSELALLFITDSQTRFNLSLECGDFAVAKETATELNVKPVWGQLSNAAATIGDFKLAQYSSAKAENVAQSALLSLVTGDYDAIRHLCKREVNPHLKMQYAMCVHDAEARTHTLMERGQYVLGYLTANCNNLHDLASTCLEHITDSEVRERVKSIACASPSSSINMAEIKDPEPVTDNWPLLPVNESVFTRLLTQPESMQYSETSRLTHTDFNGNNNISNNDTDGNNYRAGAGSSSNNDNKKENRFVKSKWESDRLMEGGVVNNNNHHANANDMEEVIAEEMGGGGGGEKGGWDEDEDDLAIDLRLAREDEKGTASHLAQTDALHDTIHSEGADAQVRGNVTCKPRPSISLHWISAYRFAACHVAAGEFDSALKLLSEQIGLINPAPLQPYMQALWVAINVARPALLVSGVQYALATEPNMRIANAVSSPLLPHYVPLLSRKCDEMKKMFTEGRFVDSRAMSESIMHQAVLTIASDENEQMQVHGFVDIAAEYARALEMQLYIRGAQLEQSEALELALHLTDFNLINEHKVLVITQAMSKAFKTKNYLLASHLARRLLELNPSAKKEQQARAIIAEAQRNPNNAIDIKYDNSLHSLICVISHAPIPPNQAGQVSCSYCKSPVMPEFAGKLCPICKLCAMITCV